MNFCNGKFFICIALITFFISNCNVQERKRYKSDKLQGDWNIYYNRHISVSENNNYELYLNGKKSKGNLWHTYSDSDFIVLMDGTQEVKFVINPEWGRFFFYEYQGNGLNPGKLIGIMSKNATELESDIVEFLQGTWYHLEGNQEIVFENNAYIIRDIKEDHYTDRYIMDAKTEKTNRSYYLGTMASGGAITQQTLNIYIYDEDMISINVGYANQWLGKEFYVRK